MTKDGKALIRSIQRQEDADRSRRVERVLRAVKGAAKVLRTTELDALETIAEGAFGRAKLGR